jgi:F-type H+-transporting ATPase subunit beta
VRKRALFPAIDPSASLSRALASGQASARHRDVAARATALLEEYEALDPTFARDGEDDQGARGRRLLGYLTQPFMTTEPFHGRPARESRLERVLCDVEAILAGEPVRNEAGELSP